MKLNEVLIAIPSKARYDRIMKYTGKWILNSPFDWRVFVEPDEIPLYAKVIPIRHLISIKHCNLGLAYSMNKIGEYARYHGYKYILKIDDDCKAFECYPDNGTVENLKALLAEIITDMEANPQIGGVRFIQKRFWLYRKKDQKKYTHQNKPLWGISLYRTLSYPFLPTQCRQFTDTIHSLYMWRDNWITLTYGKVGVDVLQNAGKGGDHCFDRKLDAYNTINYLKSNDFPLVDFKNNSNKDLLYDIDISAYDKGSCI